MSLLSTNMTDCVMIVVNGNEPDGQGGERVVTAEGESFKAAIVLDNSIEALKAQKQGVTSVYTVTTRKDHVLSYNDVFKRKSDGETFRVTSNGGDKLTPACSRLNMSQVRAEKWRLPE
ncbi:MAG: hypothetical protein J6S14_13450 [Clostridia bacterium]|nr:hypothetical protein [Clostridia bacterium]